MLLWLQPFPVTLDGVVEVLVLAQWQDTGHAVFPDVIRAGSMQMQTPTHSYLFDSSGKLLYANLQAKRSFKAKGKISKQKSASYPDNVTVWWRKGADRPA